MIENYLYYYKNYWYARKFYYLKSEIMVMMGFFHRSKFLCEIDQLKFNTHEELISHMRQIHHYPIVKCHDCRKEFIHEKDRLHHVREEHERKVDYRKHKGS